MNTEEIMKTPKEHFMELSANNFEQLDEMRNFLGKYKLLKLNLEDIEDFCMGKHVRY